MSVKNTNIHLKSGTPLKDVNTGESIRLEQDSSFTIIRKVSSQDYLVRGVDGDYIVMSKFTDLVTI